MRRIVGVGVLGVSAWLALAGCASRDDAVAPASTLSPSSKGASPSSTRPVAPVMPAAVKVQDRAGAEAAFRYWVETYTYGFATGDCAPMQAVVTSACPFCTDVLKDIERLRETGQHYSGGDDKVTALVSTQFEGNGSYLLRAIISQSASVLLDARGEPVRTSKPTKAISLDVKVLWTTSQWKIDRAAVAKR